jgi:Amt family ammonium transporter
MRALRLLTLAAFVIAAPAAGLAEEAAAAAAPAAPAAEAAPPAGATAAPAAPAAPAMTAETVQTNLNFVWTLLAAFLVFIMQAGFAMVETGFTRAKNAVNIMMKNTMDFAVGALAYWAVGFGLMFGVSKTGWFGTGDFFLSGATGDGGPWNLAFWMFQVVFAATAATIISGAVAERTKFSAYIIYSVVVSLVIYPIYGKWAWGGAFHGEAANGWLQAKGFIDFAGSSVVHSIGGWLSLAGAVVVGPRIGKYAADGRVKAIPGHNFPLAFLGLFLLWFGWYGFNPGSTVAGTPQTAGIAVTTTLAASAGATAAMLYTWFRYKKPDAGMVVNGALAGLVAITAGCANVTPLSAVVIGAIGGVLVVLSVLFFDRIKVDDPVGAISVHGVNGAWGTLAAGLFNAAGFSWSQVGVQLLGIGAAFAFAFGSGLVLFKLIDLVVGMRVSPEEELAGLDFAEHGASAYPDFQTVHLGSLFTPGEGTPAAQAVPATVTARATGGAT